MVGQVVAGERGLADGPDESLLERRPPEVEQPERPAVLDDPLGQDLAEVGPVLGLDLEPGDVPLLVGQADPGDAGRRLQRLADRRRRPSDFEDDRPLLLEVVEPVVERRPSP